MKILLFRLKLIWRVITEKQVIVITETHKPGTHKYNVKYSWDTRSPEDLYRMIDDVVNDLKP